MTYTIAGPLTVEEVGGHAEALRKLLADGNESTLVVDLEDLGQFDILGLQLLYSVEKECTAARKQLRLKGRENVRRLGNMIAFCGLPPIEGVEAG
ncbi:MAG: lipid asymmetry maintenance protein MlaB [Spirochaetaceae bacterium]